MTTMLILSRGSSGKTKNMLKDLHKLIPSVRESKYDQKNTFNDLRELMSMNECTSTIYFESTKRNDYTWIASEEGPSIRFHTYNLFTMQDLSFVTNFYKECGVKIFFDEHFEKNDNLVIVKNLFKKVFVESEVFDRIVGFYYLDKKIWVRFYGIKDGIQEIGPRIVLEVNKIFEKCFNGNVLFNSEDKENKKEEEIEKKNEENNKRIEGRKVAKRKKIQNDKEIENYKKMKNEEKKDN